MSCGTCIRWVRRRKPPLEGPRWATRYGFCRWPGIGVEPFWRAEHPEGYLMIPETREGCPAEKTRKPR